MAAGSGSVSGDSPPIAGKAAAIINAITTNNPMRLIISCSSAQTF
jgi:hypothetical protein